MAIFLFPKKDPFCFEYLPEERRAITSEIAVSDFDEELEVELCKLVCRLNNREQIIKSIAYNERTKKLIFVSDNGRGLESRVYAHDSNPNDLDFPWRLQFEVILFDKNREMKKFYFWERIVYIPKA